MLAVVSHEPSNLPEDTGYIVPSERLTRRPLSSWVLHLEWYLFMSNSRMGAWHPIRKGDN